MASLIPLCVEGTISQHIKVIPSSKLLFSKRCDWDAQCNIKYKKIWEVLVEHVYIIYSTVFFMLININVKYF